MCGLIGLLHKTAHSERTAEIWFSTSRLSVSKPRAFMYAQPALTEMAQLCSCNGLFEDKRDAMQCAGQHNASRQLHNQQWQHEQQQQQLL